MMYPFLKGIKMKQLMVITFLIIIMIVFSGCGIPDLPGPIGIPGF